MLTVAWSPSGFYVLTALSRGVKFNAGYYITEIPIIALVAPRLSPGRSLLALSDHCLRCTPDYYLPLEAPIITTRTIHKHHPGSPGHCPAVPRSSIARPIIAAPCTREPGVTLITVIIVANVVTVMMAPAQ
jgi:hypothetical protein